MDAMSGHEPIWLIYNEASGSNDRDALQAVDDALNGAGFVISGRTCFPHDQPPDAARLDGAGIDTVCVFAGDGTIHAIVTSLFGWSGRVLVLPGGTMNMLSHRLHGDAMPTEIIEKVGQGRGTIVRPSILKNRHDVGLTGALAGPGAAWNNVREAMRHSAIGEMASAALDAVVASVSGERVICKGREDVRPAGYAAITVVPLDEGIAVKGFYAEAPGDFVGQLVALLQRNFRNGPHDDLGTFPRVEIASSEGRPMGLLIDGEPEQGQPAEVFSLGACEVDLIATHHAA